MQLQKVVNFKLNYLLSFQERISNDKFVSSVSSEEETEMDQVEFQESCKERERSLSEENTEVESESHKEREKGKGKRKEKMKEREEKEDDSSYYDYGEHGENNEGYLSEEENLKKLRFKYKGY